jgi:hypothetical protein
MLNYISVFCLSNIDAHLATLVQCRVARWFVFKPKIQIWENMEGIAMEDVGIIYGHLVHFTVFCYILLTFGIVRGSLVYFPLFWCFVPRKIWQPWFNDES